LEREKFAYMGWVDNPYLPKFLNMSLVELIQECEKLPKHPIFDQSVKNLTKYFETYGKLVQYVVLLRYYYAAIHKKYDPPKSIVERRERKNVSKMYSDDEFDFTWDSSSADVSYWIRPCELSESPVLFENGIPDAQRIRKGFINTSYFISAILSVLEKDPQLIKSLFVETDFVSGRHTFSFYTDRGTQKFVTIDDSLPIEYHGQFIATNSSSPNEFWIHLLEKAYAKFLGGYHCYGHGGNPTSVLKTLFGYRLTNNLPVGKSVDVETIWRQLSKDFSKGNILMASNNLGYNAKTETDCHAYSILQVVEASDNGCTHRLIKLKNPWGLVYSASSLDEETLEKANAIMEWKGKFSDGDSSWTDSLKQQLKFESKNDGVFWMRCEDFVIHWNAVTSTDCN